MRAVDLVEFLRFNQQKPVELVPNPDVNKGVRFDVLYDVEVGEASFAQVEVDGTRYILTVTRAKER